MSDGWGDRGGCGEWLAGCLGGSVGCLWSLAPIVIGVIIGLLIFRGCF